MVARDGRTGELLYNEAELPPALPGPQRLAQIIDAIRRTQFPTLAIWVNTGFPHSYGCVFCVQDCGYRKPTRWMATPKTDDPQSSGWFPCCPGHNELLRELAPRPDNDAPRDLYPIKPGQADKPKPPPRDAQGKLIL